MHVTIYAPGHVFMDDFYLWGVTDFVFERHAMNESHCFFTMHSPPLLITEYRGEKVKGGIYISVRNRTNEWIVDQARGVTWLAYPDTTMLSLKVDLRVDPGAVSVSQVSECENVKHLTTLKVHGVNLS